MADFCKECSIAHFGKDYGDLAGLVTKQEVEEGKAVHSLCEGCGDGWFDHEGRRMSDIPEQENS